MARAVRTIGNDLVGGRVESVEQSRPGRGHRSRLGLPHDLVQQVVVTALAHVCHLRAERVA